MPKNSPEEPTGNCDLCGENPTTNEDFCYGCKQNVCEFCSVNMNLPFGGHDPEDHLEDDEFEDEDDC